MTGFNWKISGPAGEGIKVAGLIFAQTAFRQGLYIHGYTEYPSLIRGGLNTFQVCADVQPVLAPQAKFDLEISLNDPSLGKPKNIFAIGLASAKLGLKLAVLQTVIKETFAKKTSAVIKQNLAAAEQGYQSCQNPAKPIKLPPLKNQILLSGNDALSLGALAGGLKFFTAYPMSPATSILHFLAAKAKTAQIVVRHGEDEIGVVNMALGASFAGARSMVATSGGGFSLMTEALGLAGITETPLVIISAMRPGPATGMPTWTGQGDLLFAIHASQDEFPRIVLTPGDPEEAFNLTKLALNLSEKYQLPVIILTDKYLGESYFTFNKPAVKQTNQRFGFASIRNLNTDIPFPRYADSKTGVSLRTIPGQPGGVHLANSYEHDQYGYATESSRERIKQVNKRAKKTLAILNDPVMVKPKLIGPKSASTTLISWGSNKGSLLTALKFLPDTNFIHFPSVWPFPRQEFLYLLKNSKKLITIELNSTGQLNELISQETGIQIPKQILKYDGRPFYPEEIINQVKKYDKTEH